MNKRMIISRALPVGLALLVGLVVMGGAALATPPVISNLQVQQRPHSNLVDITFDLADDGTDPILLVPMFNRGDGLYSVRCDSLSGDWYTTAGPGKTITWDPRAQLPDFVGDQCRIRLFALDGDRWPDLQFFRASVQDTVPLAAGVPDTVGYGRPYSFAWMGSTPLLEGMPMQMVVEMDTIYPLDDGLYGFRWRYLGEDCNPALEDCWHPRYFDETTGDSVSYYAPINGLTLQNDGSGQGVLRERLPSGVASFQVTTRDLILDELPEARGRLDLVVNYDPETHLLNGETDWAHPEDPEVYPYYIRLNDPEQVHHPFTAGDRIPDRTYVVFKGLFRDDPRDMVLDPGYEMGSVVVVEGVRSNYTGGTYSFSTGASPVDAEPDWPAGAGGWAADTLGFLVGPRTQFTFNMQAVDEHGRRDGTPASLEFEVGHPPCVQCVEFTPQRSAVTGFDPDLECYEGQGDHPCLGGDPAAFYIPGAGATYQPGREYLEVVGQAYLAIDRVTMQAEFRDQEPDPQVYYSFPCNIYEVSAWLQGRDDPREAWDDPVYRTMGWHYQVDYDCDPYNAIQDGPGEDRINWPTWGLEVGTPYGQIDGNTGLWRMTFRIGVPQQLVNQGPETFKIILLYTQAGGDAELADELYNICIRQLGDARMRALALDQTRCGFSPARPASYHLFHTVRPAGEPAEGQTWRDCIPPTGGIVLSLDLSRGTMASHTPEEAVEAPFRIVLDVMGADVVCDPEELKGGIAQRPWYER